MVIESKYGLAVPGMEQGGPFDVPDALARRLVAGGVATRVLDTSMVEREVVKPVVRSQTRRARRR